MTIKALSSLKWQLFNPDLCRETVESLLDSADIKINGNRDWDIQVHDARLYQRILANASLGLGESYMDGWWDCKQLDEFIFRLLRNGMYERVISYKDVLSVMKAKFTNLQRYSRAFEVGQRHYDIGDDLYRVMLDPMLIYSCGYWKSASNLQEAQRAKIELVCQKLKLEPGMRVLDIGCGWGGTAKYMAENYKVCVDGVTVSENQAKYAREICQGLPVKIELKDYREIDGKYDRVYSIGMFEHVGYKNYKAFVDVLLRCLPREGYCLLHSVGGNASDTNANPWVEKYIFPNSMLPSIAQIGAMIENRMVMEDWQNFGPDYTLTLQAWYQNFVDNWPNLKNNYYDERFFRTWTFYLMSFAGAFRARHIELWQVVLSPGGETKRYDAPR